MDDVGWNETPEEATNELRDFGPVAEPLVVPVVLGKEAEAALEPGALM